jgi:hypothetical protein
MDLVTHARCGIPRTVRLRLLGTVSGLRVAGVQFVHFQEA